MKTSALTLSEIYNFRAIGDRLATAGQPTREQFQLVHEAGFEAVINLALPTSDNALANEGSVVTALGLSYIHIPVDFKAPAAQDFQMFCRVMESFGDRPVFVHCAANMRVSAFVFLYRVLCQRIALPEAERDLHAIWQPDEIWSQFIKEQITDGAIHPETVVQKQLDAYNAHDIDTLMSTYAEDIELFEHPSKLLASGAAQVRERQAARLREPNLHAALLKRMVMGNMVIDQEKVTRTFPEGTGQIELVAIYEVRRGRIAKAWFLSGARTLDAAPDSADR
jgi:protein tyrosine phosphatase (PTP) superfamily phosphohydrolase (DUF442 family)